MRHTFWLSLAAALAVAGCAPSADAPADLPKPAADILSTDFALVPCGHEAGLPGPCVQVLAGGKRLLIGTPAGIGQALAPADLATLEAVFLPSLQANALAGLDEVRTNGWLAGRETALSVAGPEGTRAVIGAINSAYEISDAQLFVEHAPAGGFDAALLAVVPGEQAEEATVFDTGDLIVTRRNAGIGLAAYRIDYLGHVVSVVPCGANKLEESAVEDGFVLSCAPDGTPWPLKAVEFIYRESGPAGE